MDIIKKCIKENIIALSILLLLAVPLQVIAQEQKGVFSLNSEQEEASPETTGIQIKPLDKTYKINTTYKTANKYDVIEQKGTNQIIGVSFFDRPKGLKYSSHVMKEHPSPQCAQSLGKAQKYLEKEDYSEARQVLLDYIAEKPKTENIPKSVFGMLGNLWFIEGKMEEARKVYEEGYDAYPDDEDLLEKYALTSYKAEYYRSASQLYERLYDTGRDKNLTTRLEYAAQSNIKIKNWEDAKRLYKRMIDLPGNTEQRWFKNIIALCKRLDLPEEAETYERQLEELISLAGMEQKTHENKNMKGRDEEDLLEKYALTSYKAEPQIYGILREPSLIITTVPGRSQEKNIRRSGGMMSGQYQLAMAKAMRYFEKENYSEARKAIIDFLATKPKAEMIHSDVYVFLGYLWLLEGETEEARKVYKEGYKVYPAYIEILNGLAFTSNTPMQSEEVSQLYEKLLGTSTEEYLMRLEEATQSNIKLKKWDEAKQLYIRMLGIPGGQKERYLENIITLCKRLDQPDEAKDYKKLLQELLYGNPG